MSVADYAEILMQQMRIQLSYPDQVIYRMMRYSREKCVIISVPAFFLARENSVSDDHKSP